MGSPVPTVATGQEGPGAGLTTPPLLGLATADDALGGPGGPLLGQGSAPELLLDAVDLGSWSAPDALPALSPSAVGNALAEIRPDQGLSPGGQQ